MNASNWKKSHEGQKEKIGLPINRKSFQNVYFNKQGKSLHPINFILPTHKVFQGETVPDNDWWPEGWGLAALKADGSVVTWGDADFGGDSTAVREQLAHDVQHVNSTFAAFAALKGTGAVRPTAKPTA